MSVPQNSVLTFLVVEDNPVNMELFADLLRTAGHTVLTASTAEDGLWKARDQHPDVILMDVQLPGMDGLEATARLKADPETKAIPVVALTAHAMRGDAERAMAKGCSGYITKPIETRNFLQTILRALSVPKVPLALDPTIPLVVGEDSPTFSGFRPFPVVPTSAEDDLLAPLPPLSPKQVASSAGKTEVLDVVPPPVATTPPASIILGRGRGRTRRILRATQERRRKLLIVDDESLNREMMEGMTHVLGYETLTAADGIEALSILNAEVDLILVDTMMPVMDGFELVRLIRQDMRYADLPIIMVTALSGKDDRLRAVEAGANDYIPKPIDRVEMRIRLEAQLRFKAIQDDVKRHRLELEATVKSRTADLRRAMQELSEGQQRTHRAQFDLVQRLALVAENRWDPLGGFHVYCMGQYSAILGRALGLPEVTVETLTHASGLHDVGLLQLPDELIEKQGRFNPTDLKRFQEHTTIGARMLAGSQTEILRTAEAIARSHHERWDGNGYPNGWIGDDIPLYGRICAIADGYDSLLRADPSLGVEESLSRLAEGSGTLYDPQMILLFQEHREEVEVIYARFQQRIRAASQATPVFAS